MDVAVGSKQGIQRKRSSDASLSEMIYPGAVFFGVADGFGTVRHGLPAALVALESVRDYLRGCPRWRCASEGSIRTLLLSALDHANTQLYAGSRSHEDFVGSGASLTVILIVGRSAFVGHVGDARAYLLRAGRLEPLTTDDALFADVVASGITSLPAKPRGYSVLWRSLGAQAKLEASIAHVALSAGDQVILCTDGVHRCISADEICDVLLESSRACEVVERLLAVTKVRGGFDNATLIVGRDLCIEEQVPEAVAGIRKSTTRGIILACIGFLVALISLLLCIFRA